MQRKRSCGTGLENCLELEPFPFSAKRESGRGSRVELWMVRLALFLAAAAALEFQQDGIVGLEETLGLLPPAQGRSP